MAATTGPGLGSFGMGLRLDEAAACSLGLQALVVAAPLARGRVIVDDAVASGTANTFSLGADGSLSAVGSDTPNGQAATCWIVSARGFFYTTNTGSDTITGYAEDDRGQLQLLSADGVSARTDGGPIDIAAAPGGPFLYELTAPGARSGSTRWPRTAR